MTTPIDTIRMLDDISFVLRVGIPRSDLEHFSTELSGAEAVPEPGALEVVGVGTLTTPALPRRKA